MLFLEFNQGPINIIFNWTSYIQLNDKSLANIDLIWAIIIDGGVFLLSERISINSNYEFVSYVSFYFIIFLLCSQ